VTRVAVTAALLATVAYTGPVQAQRPSSTDVVSRASAYVTNFLNRFTSVVAEETYVQRIDVLNGQTRTLKADFLLVKVGPQDQWLPFRDVFEVNGTRLRDHETRLVDLFTNPSPDILAQARAIHAESYKYNIGANRSINNPMLGIALLQPSLLPHFTFSLGGTDRIEGERVDVLKFEESGHPTIVHQNNGADLPCQGRYWIAETTGMLLRSELLLDTKEQKTRVTITFKPDDRFGVAVPVKMEESYSPSVGSRTVATATYGRFRQFQIKTEEAPKELPPISPAR
jgi:hypothetical protein